MDSLPTYFISYYNACKWLLIALEWDLSITVDRFEPSRYRGTAAATTTGTVSSGSISYTCITKTFPLNC